MLQFVRLAELSQRLSHWLWERASTIRGCHGNTGVRGDQREVVNSPRWDNLRQFVPRWTRLLISVECRGDTRGHRAPKRLFHDENWR